MNKPHQHRCKVCGGIHEGGNELRYSRRFNVYVHENCKTTCIRCRNSKDPDGFVCEQCEGELKALKEDELPASTHSSIDLRDRAHSASMSQVTGKPYPTRVHQRDDD